MQKQLYTDCQPFLFQEMVIPSTGNFSLTTSFKVNLSPCYQAPLLSLPGSSTISIVILLCRALTPCLLKLLQFHLAFNNKQAHKGIFLNKIIILALKEELILPAFWVNPLKVSQLETIIDFLIINT